jgi:hypothetical protein
VYCGSNAGTSPSFGEAAQQLGSALAHRGIGLVYGGGHVGLMGLVADAAIAADGEVIGVNSQILSESNSSSGVGFAIPINLVKRVSQEIINTGKVQYSYLGISAASSIDLTLIQALHLPNNTQGVVVGDVQPDGPAAKAGLKSATTANVSTGAEPTSADIITAIDNVKITDMSGLISYLATKTQPGQTINLTVLRDGKRRVIVPAGSLWDEFFDAPGIDLGPREQPLLHQHLGARRGCGARAWAGRSCRRCGTARPRCRAPHPRETHGGRRCQKTTLRQTHPPALGPG